MPLDFKRSVEKLARKKDSKSSDQRGGEADSDSSPSSNTILSRLFDSLRSNKK